MSRLDEVFKLVSIGKSKLIAPAVQAALDGGAAAAEVLNTMISAMDEVGEKFKRETCMISAKTWWQ